jgi:hypothetical protein
VPYKISVLEVGKSRSSDLFIDANILACVHWKFRSLSIVGIKLFNRVDKNATSRY